MTEQARVAELRREVKAHKAAIRRHRDALTCSAAALADLERECAARGIQLDQGEGENSWPRPQSSNSKH